MLNMYSIHMNEKMKYNKMGFNKANKKPASSGHLRNCTHVISSMLRYCMLSCLGVCCEFCKTDVTVYLLGTFDVSS